MKISRSYVIKLQNKIQALEADLAQAVEEGYANLDAEVMIRSAGLVRFKQHDEGRYLGASSGIAMTRLVMELAKQNTDSKTIKEVVPETTAGQSKDTFAKESSKPTSKVYPLVSDVAAPNLPSKELTGNLINVFNRTGIHPYYDIMDFFSWFQLSIFCRRSMSHLFVKRLRTYIKAPWMPTRTLP